MAVGLLNPFTATQWKPNVIFISFPLFLQDIILFKCYNFHTFMIDFLFLFFGFLQLMTKVEKFIPIYPRFFHFCNKVCGFVCWYIQLFLLRLVFFLICIFNRSNNASTEGAASWLAMQGQIFASECSCKSWCNTKRHYSRNGTYDQLLIYFVAVFAKVHESCHIVHFSLLILPLDHQLSLDWQRNKLRQVD